LKIADLGEAWRADSVFWSISNHKSAIINPINPFEFLISNFEFLFSP